MRTLATIIIISNLVIGCGGRTANPVMASQYGDSQKTCRGLEFEMQSVQGEIQRLLPDRDKTAQNVALGVAGAFVLVPWFFMDFKNAEATEYEAYRQRYNHLASIALDKRCDVKPTQYPTAQQLQNQHKSQSSNTTKPQYN
jgi:hypothetical protein